VFRPLLGIRITSVVRRSKPTLRCLLLVEFFSTQFTASHQRANDGPQMSSSGSPVLR
ncbi:hypothetical protein HAX54_029023, partial [Datura stramonium]|nr:hypothetical protein [Datura stramonium]